MHLKYKYLLLAHVHFKNITGWPCWDIDMATDKYKSSAVGEKYSLDSLDLKINCRFLCVVRLSSRS